MPELPEVETVRSGLGPVIEARRIVRAQVNRPDLRFPLPDGMAERLTGARVEALGRRSKYLLARLSTAETLLVHLGMSGRILIGGAAPGVFHHAVEPLGKHDHVVLDFEGGLRVTYNDARRFGAMDLMPTALEDRHPLLAHLGPEPLGNDFHGDYLGRRLAGRSMPIKAALLDQRIIAGLGNIYVSESLHRAAIDPRRAAGQLGGGDVDRLVTAIRDVLAEAIAAGGSSLRDYRQATGELGYFQHAFRTYDREGTPCPRPGCPGRIERIVQSGRSTFFCPVCQH